jgi:hypothetical protein
MIDDECGAVGGMRIGRGNRSTRRKPASVPLCPPQIPHDLTWARTRAASVLYNVPDLFFLTGNFTDVSQWAHFILHIYKIIFKSEVNHCHYSILCYHSNELASTNLLLECTRKLRSKSGRIDHSFVSMYGVCSVTGDNILMSIHVKVPV